MIEKQFFFLCGLPRSGSTVLASILNQNPEIYVTPTSPLLDLLEYNEYGWNTSPSVIANPIIDKNIEISYAVINGCWEHVPQKIIIDKCRGWVNHINAMQQIFGKKPKIIINVRDIPSIIASYIRVLRESSTQPTYIDEMILEKGIWLNDANRTQMIWQQHVQPVLQWFKDAYKEHKDCFYIIEYDDLVKNKESVITGLYDFLELPQYKHEFENIVNVTQENDVEAWRVEHLHKVNLKLERVSKHPKEILGDALCDKFAKLGSEFWRTA